MPGVSRPEWFEAFMLCAEIAENDKLPVLVCLLQIKFSVMGFIVWRLINE